MARFCVAVTGGIASGKSAVTAMFEALGVTVIDADIAARDAVAVDSPGLADVVAAFGPEVLSADGALDRANMRRLVFGDPSARQRLEGIVHPRVRELMLTRCAQAPGSYVIAAIPLLAEGGGRNTYPWLQRILVIDTPVEVQRFRLMARDGVDAELAERMIDAQATRAQRLAIADDVLINDGDLARLKSHVAALDQRYRSIATTYS